VLLTGFETQRPEASSTGRRKAPPSGLQGREKDQDQPLILKTIASAFGRQGACALRVIKGAQHRGWWPAGGRSSPWGLHVQLHPTTAPLRASGPACHRPPHDAGRSCLIPPRRQIGNMFLQSQASLAPSCCLRHSSVMAPDHHCRSAPSLNTINHQEHARQCAGN